ncbi:MAG: helix-turn-helix transcriptional regulator [Oscillospiraceae bacterium]|nr:helix-turn-helix transcriptional regulator [Oscillospiraceae bacterium]
MVDTKKLRGRMAEMGYSQTSLAKHLQINKNTLNAKMNGRSDFSVDDALKICNALNISDDKMKCEIFLQ